MNIRAKRVVILVLTLCTAVWASAAETPPDTAGGERQKLERSIENLKADAARNPDDADVWFSLGVAYHDLCNGYEVKCAMDAVAALEKSEALRHDAVTLAYLGSAWTLVGRDAENPMTKIDGVLKGNEFLDEAVRISPSDVVVRRIRYENNFALPDIFERKPVAEKDVDFLIKLYAKNPGAFEGQYDPAHVFYFKARFLLLRNDWKSARKYALIAKNIVKDPALAAEIQNFLEGKE